MIKVGYNIKKYRNQLFEVINHGDTIIELGCHVGTTSKMILDNFDDITLISVDNSPEAIPKMDNLKKEYNNLCFIHGDVRLHDVLSLVFKKTQSCDVLSVDLGGGYHPDTVFKVFYIWSSTFKPKSTIIRNRGLLEFLNSTSKSDESFYSSEGYLESYKNEGIPPQIKEFELWTNSLK
ncbi:class I SAM-dependent methyltransferase [Methanobrevibacter woesei]|uniref:class I SAM-dependent methyltransferase n=1 Tax=Methanobrevibacter woesei TaxID=190976 RepID=UPI0023F46F56|nr:class I SAM-dependent methyltransferase [Methanobrevibacter woesei]